MAVEGIRSVSSVPSFQSTQGTQTAAAASVAHAPAQSTAVSAEKKPEVSKNKAQSEAGSPESSNEQIRKAVEKINNEIGRRECRYSFHEDTNRVMIKIVDKETEEVIREFPAEETLDMISKAWELAGLLVDEKL